MGKAVAKKETGRLPALAKKIEGHHTAVYQALGYALDRAMKAGDVLNEAKSLVKHGEWLDWLKENISFSQTQAGKYMKLANNRPQVEQMAATKFALGENLPINEAVAYLAKPRPKPEPEEDEPEEEEDEDEPDEALQALLDQKLEIEAEIKRQGLPGADYCNVMVFDAEAAKRMGGPAAPSVGFASAAACTGEIAEEAFDKAVAALRGEPIEEDYALHKARKNYLTVVEECLTQSELDAEQDLILSRLREVAKRK